MAESIAVPAAANRCRNAVQPTLQTAAAGICTFYSLGTEACSMSNLFTIIVQMDSWYHSESCLSESWQPIIKGTGRACRRPGLPCPALMQPWSIYA